MLEANDALREQVSRWYEENLEGWRLDFGRAGAAFTMGIQRGQTRVAMADAGLGISQALPVVTQKYALALADEAVPLSIVEQPELHLHAAAHGPLADLFVQNAGRPGVRILVETHSENFLLRIRRRVADGSLDPSHVALYWIHESPAGESQIRNLEVRSNGEIPDWPEGVFAEGYREVVAMRRAARNADREP